MGQKMSIGMLPYSMTSMTGRLIDGSDTCGKAECGGCIDSDTGGDVGCSRSDCTRLKLTICCWLLNPMPTPAPCECGRPTLDDVLAT